MRVDDKPLVAITGSSGLIGQRLSSRLQRDFRLIQLDVKPPEQHFEGAAWLECDLTDADNVRQVLDDIRLKFGHRIASVVHLAAYYDFSGEPSPLYKELTVEGTRRLLRGLKPFEVEQFVFSSSLLVMRPADDSHPLTAFSPVEAEWDYPQSKLAAEAVIDDESGDMPTVILRIAGVYDEDCHSIPLAQQISRIHQKQLESHLFPGDKTHGQSFIHLDDLVECFDATIARRCGTRCELPQRLLLLIGEEDVMSYAELQDELGRLIHGKDHWTTLRIPKAVAKAGAWVKKLASDKEHVPFIKPWMIDLADQNYPVNIERARKLLGWEPQHTLRGTLREMIRRLHDDPQRWYETNHLPVPDEVLQHASRQ